MTSRVSTGSLVAHHLRSRSGAVGIVAALVLVLSLLATAAPLALGVLADAAMRDRLASLAVTERDVVADPAGGPQTVGVTSTPETDVVWARWNDQIDGIRDSAEAPLPDLLGPAQTVTRTGMMYLAPTREIALAFSPDAERHVEIVEGSVPSTPPAMSEVSAEVPPIQIMLSEQSADELGWTVGETRTVAAYGAVVSLTLSGIFRATDPAEGFWQHAPSIIDPQIDDDGNRARAVKATAFAHPGALAFANYINQELATTVWFPLDADAIDAADAAEVAASLRGLTAVSHTIGTQADGWGILGLRFEADIAGQIETALAQQTATNALLAMLVAGPAGVAVAVVVLGCRLILEGRRPALRLLSARGASIAQLRGLLAAEGVIVGPVAAIVGAAVAIVLGAAWASAVPTAGTLAAALVPTALLAFAPLVILWVLAPTAAERLPRADLGRRRSRLRTILEGAVCVLAAVAVALLLLRGYSDGVDVLLAATPLLIALAACLLTLRLYPLPLRALWRRARAGAGLNAFLGAARALREPAIGLTPVLALTVGVSVAVSAGVLLSVVDRGTADAARAQVGADMRVTGGSFSPDTLVQVGELPGVAAATGISGLVSATVDVAGVRKATSVFVVDAAALRGVQGDGPGMLPPGTALAPGDDPVEMIVSDALADTIDGETDLHLDGADARVSGITRGPVPIGSRENWAAIDVSAADTVLGRDPSDRVLLLRLDETADADTVRAGLLDLLGPTVRVDTATDVASRLSGGPAAQGVRVALLAATASAALLGALALAMTLTLAAGARARTVALLRTLGAPRRAGTALTLWEVCPPVVAALVTGTVFGALVPLVMMAAVDLRPFTGSSIAPAYVIDPAVLAVTLGGFLALSALSTTLALFVSRRVRAAGALRTVEEG
ncbi:FtsX-like permease family protein [Microbacterium telephonicum]|uniref:Putative ABC transport system permease protein n=1 Tax=Microbacterium telephonicum TaxID=1714841 RepID=A0A498C2Z7_9MICO|nr:FtsX-like permease family protein [Microbacterium telephonicum]RLK49006.1 putative ABC transport system permease protein [Microbacterium telephonicum]